MEPCRVVFGRADYTTTTTPSTLVLEFAWRCYCLVLMECEVSHVMSNSTVINGDDGFVFILFLAECMDALCRVGFGRTGHYSAVFNSKVLLLGVECNMARSRLHTHVLFKYTAMATTHARLLIDFDFGWMHEMVSYWLWTNREYVGISAFLNSKVLLLGVELMHYAWHDRVCTPMCCSNALQCNNGDNTRLRLDFDFVGLYGTVSCWLCLDAQIVRLH